MIPGFFSGEVDQSIAIRLGEWLTARWLLPGDGRSVQGLREGFLLSRSCRAMMGPTWMSQI